MKTAKELYPDYVDGQFGPCEYNPIIESFGEVLVQVDDSHCTGDSRVLLKDGDRFGILVFGWGSCSGCDRIQGCSCFDEIDELIVDLKDSVLWGSRAETLGYLKNHDWEGDYCGNDEETKSFVSQAIAFLEESNEQAGL